MKCSKERKDQSNLLTSDTTSLNYSCLGATMQRSLLALRCRHWNWKYTLSDPCKVAAYKNHISSTSF